MTEGEFWTALEFRVCREIERSGGERLRFLWCDGLFPDNEQTDTTALVGRALISEDGGRTFENYRFRLSLDPAMRGRRGDWDALLPSETARGWLTVDRDGRRLEIRPT